MACRLVGSVLIVIRAASALSAACGLWACADGSTLADRARLEQVRGEFASEFEFRPSADVYLDARHLQPGCPTVDRGKAVYRAFWFNEDGTRRGNSSYVYLNLQDSKGRFCFQLYWSPEIGRLEKSEKAYY
jgi:hypothetical protein